MISAPRSATIAKRRSLGASRAIEATARPAARRRACPMTMVVLSTTTEASPASRPTWSRMRKALRGSPPTEAVGVARLTGSAGGRGADAGSGQEHRPAHGMEGDRDDEGDEEHEHHAPAEGADDTPDGGGAEVPQEPGDEGEAESGEGPSERAGRERRPPRRLRGGR